MAGSLLHIGCGSEPLPHWLSGYAETRLDLDPRYNPDVVAPMTRLGDIGPFDACFSAHALEHVPPGHVHHALTEQRRVLRDGGLCICIVPDLEDVRPTTETIGDTPQGPLCGLDLIYGWHKFTADNPLMRHASGFISETLADAMRAAGFADVEVRRLPGYELIGRAIK